MAIDHDTDLLTVREAAGLLKVSAVTIRRWLKQGRLPAQRVGPKAIRISRRDLAALMAPAHQAEPASAVDAPRWTQIHTSLDTILPLTEEEKRRALEALEESRKLGERILARRAGKPLEETWPIIREAREERSNHFA